MKRMTYALALLVVLAIILAGCGSGDSSSSGGAYGGKGGGGSGGASTASSETKSASSDGAGVGDGIVSAAEVGDLGTVLVDSKGLTLYDFHKDKGGASSCYGACASAWPPLLTDRDPQAQGAADRGMLGTTKRKDGTVQVTYAGRPLYTYVGDEGPGEANGNDIDQFGAEWYALKPSGDEPEDS